MIENLWHIISNQFSVFHLNALILVGIAIFGGSLGGKLFQKISIPQVVGYIIIGLILGAMGLNIINKDIIEAFAPFNYFALGVIGFMIGGELKKEIFKKYGKQFLYILFFEGLTAFVFVGLAIFAISYFFLPLKTALALSLVLGAIASATAPAATTDVLWEYRTKGPLTTTILGIVAMDDGLSLVLFAISSSIAQSLMGSASGSIIHQIFTPIYEIGGALILGILSGFLTAKTIRSSDEKDRILTFAIGTIILLLGLSKVFGVDMLLSAMAFGTMLVNYSPEKSKKVFELIKNFSPPIYVLFFVMFGAKLNIKGLSPFIIYMALGYLIFRTLGKGFGAYAGAKISKAPETVIKNLPFCLFSQAGVAIGLTIFAAQKFDPALGNSIVIVITTTTFVVQLLGPPSTKFAVFNAKENGLNITEDDFIERAKAQDVMEKDFPEVHEHTALSKVINIFSNTDNTYFPVTSHDYKLMGIITLKSLKETLLETDAYEILLGIDLMQPVKKQVKLNTPLTEVKNIFAQTSLNYIPVTDEKEKLAGYIERSKIDLFISRKLLELRRSAE